MQIVNFSFMAETWSDFYLGSHENWPFVVGVGVFCTPAFIAVGVQDSRNDASERIVILSKL
jgi:hypothetical protein